MNSPVAVLIVLTLLFAATWSRDGAGPRPDRLVAARNYVETDVLLAARESAHETAHLVRSNEQTSLVPVSSRVVEVEPPIDLEPIELTERVEVPQPVGIVPVEVVEPVVDLESVLAQATAPSPEARLPIDAWARTTLDATRIVSERMTAIGDKAVASVRSKLLASVRSSVRRMRSLVAAPLAGDALAAESVEASRR